MNREEQMKFDYETRVNRSKTGSKKWSVAKQRLGKECTLPPLSVADMEFVCCPSVEKNIVDAIKNNGVLGYTDAPQVYDEIVSSWFKQEYNFEIQNEWMVQTYGVIQAIHNAICSFSNEGDGILIQTPVYHQFKKIIDHTGRKCIENPLEIIDGKYKMNFSDLRKKAKEAKILILCSPHNPVGRVWTQEELQEVLAICIENNILVISDEVHCDFVYQGKHTLLLTLDQNHVIQCTSASKSFNLAGCNIANIIIPNNEIRNRFIHQLEQQDIHFQNYFGYQAIMGAYSEDGKKWLEGVKKVIYTNYNMLRKVCDKFKTEVKIHELEGTYLAWIDVSNLGLTDDELDHYLKENGDLVVDMGIHYGDCGTGFIRVNCACPSSVFSEVTEHFEECFAKIIEKKSF